MEPPADKLKFPMKNQSPYDFTQEPRGKRWTASTPQGQSACFSKPRVGVALVLVLAFLVLITVLVLAFFSSVTTELSGAKSYSSGVTTKQLADSTVQITIGAITQATSYGTTVAWASQPGMIRTYGKDNGDGTYSASGSAMAFYKLYSSDNMVIKTGSYTPINDVPSTWSTTPALYTDLNAPVVTGTTAHYPILDGNNLVSTWKAPLYSGSTAALTYNGERDSHHSRFIEGFWVLTGSTGMQGAVQSGRSIPLTGTTAPNPVPMPVKWLYAVARDGSLVAPTASSGSTKPGHRLASQRHGKQPDRGPHCILDG